MNNKPTYKQIEAYLLVHIHGFSHAEAGEIVGVSQQAISKRLHSLGERSPSLIPTRQEKTTLRKKISLYLTIPYSKNKHI